MFQSLIPSWHRNGTANYPTAAKGIQQAFAPQMPTVLNNQYTQGANLALQQDIFENQQPSWVSNWNQQQQQVNPVTANAPVVTTSVPVTTPSLAQGLNTTQASNALFGSPEQQLIDMNGQLQYDLPSDTPLKMVDGSGMTTAGAYNNAQGGSMFGELGDVLGSDAFMNAGKVGLGLAQTWMGMQQLDLAEEAFDFSKSAFEKNYAMQREAYEENKAAKERTMQSWNK